MELEKIGRYQIEEEIGRGGMATVFRAKDPRFERDVAVKVLPRAFLHDELFRARFAREAKTIATLEHSSIVPVYDFGEEDEQPYIVMRLMSGGSLADKLKKGRLSLAKAIKVVSQLAPALDAAHKQGIIHRDMKPANILFDQYDDAYLSDFGIARVTQAAQTLTGENVLGTPAYMSPEQVHGDKDLDGRCDLYALGIIFYQMLVGNVPYQATTPAKVMMMQVLEPVPDLLAMGLDLPYTVETWFEKAMAKDPDDRFATASDMFDALKDAMQGEEHRTLKISSKKVVGKSHDATMHSQPRTVAVKSKRGQKSLRIGAFIAGGLVVFILGIFGLQGKGPLAMLSPASPTESIAASLTPVNTELSSAVTVAPTETLTLGQPTATQSLVVATIAPAEPTETLSPTVTSTPEALALGGADKIAFFNDNDIWMMNIDGSDLQQLTDNGTEKHDLSWGPDGDFIYYISGKCIWSLEVESGWK
ncbi:MAG: protein kinase, partial [Chloroflexota bacterium]|nr:protein kinase [Chloroflexota bacterium]